MKFKSFAMLAMSGLLAASFAYVAPAMADDSMNTMEQAAQPSTPDAVAQNGMNNTQNSTGSPSDMSNTNSSTTTSPSDEATPDTATGDDDY